MGRKIDLFTAPSGLFQSASATDELRHVLVAGGAAFAGNMASGDFSSSDGSEVMFNLCEHFHQVVNSGDATQVRTAKTQSLSGSTLVRTYTFTFDLNLNLGLLDVENE